MREAHDQIALVDRNGARPPCEHEPPLFAGRFRDSVLLVIRCCDLEAHALFRVARPHCERISRVVLGRFDVILLCVCPVQLDFLAIVRDQIGRMPAAGVTPLRDEIALGVIPGEEMGEMVVHVGLGCRVLPHFREPCVQLLDQGRGVWIDPQLLGRFAGVIQVFFERGHFLLAGEIQLGLDLRQQILVEKGRDLAGLQVHDPVQSKVQIAAVELKHLAQQRPQPVELSPCPGRRLHFVWSR